MKTLMAIKHWVTGQVVAVMDSGFQFEGLGSELQAHILTGDGKTITSETAANF